MVIVATVALAIWLAGVVVLVRGYPTVVKKRQASAARPRTWRLRAAGHVASAVGIALWPVGLVVTIALSAARGDHRS